MHTYKYMRMFPSGNIWHFGIYQIISLQNCARSNKSGLILNFTLGITPLFDKIDWNLRIIKSLESLHTPLLTIAIRPLCRCACVLHMNIGTTTTHIFSFLFDMDYLFRLLKRSRLHTPIWQSKSFKLFIFLRITSYVEHLVCWSTARVLSSHKISYLFPK